MTGGTAPPAVGQPRLGIGIEIGGTKLQAALVTHEGTVLDRRTDRVDPSAGATGIRTALATLLDALLDAAGASGRRPAAVGIGFGGPVDRSRGVVATSFHVGGWGQFPLAEWVADRVRGPLGAVPCLLENDSNAAALAEATAGAGRGSRVVFYTNAGSGIGAGLVIDGRLYCGRPPGEMELGHLRLTPGGGILEEMASGWAVDRQVQEEVSRAPAGVLAREAAKTGSSPSARHLAAALAEGDGPARAILARAAGAYAHAISHAVHLLNPDVIVLGGGLAAIGEPWRMTVADRLEPLLMAPLRPAPAVRLASLGADVVPVGAAIAALTDCEPARSGS